MPIFYTEDYKDCRSSPPYINISKLHRCAGWPNFFDNRGVYIHTRNSVSANSMQNSSKRNWSKIRWTEAAIVDHYPSIFRFFNIMKHLVYIPLFLTSTSSLDLLISLKIKLRNVCENEWWMLRLNVNSWACNQSNYSCILSSRTRRRHVSEVVSKSFCSNLFDA